MARMTISIPNDVRKRMERVKDAVNWSAIAAGAFEHKLGEIASKQKEKSMENVVARLRASKLTHASHQNKEGYDAGVRWANDTADYDDLVRLRDLEIDEFFAGQPKAPYSASDYLAFAILDIDVEGTDRGGNREYTERLWGEQDERDEEEFCTGFCEGALSVFNKVAGQL
jgi:hypothetical protein